MRSIWNGTLTFGLIAIPMKLYPATQERGGISLDTLHRDDLMPVKYVRVCRDDGKEIPFEEVVKGYEYDEGMYVVLNDEDFERASLQQMKTINVHECTELSAIDPLYCNTPYYLAPDTGGEHAYALLREALKQTGKLGIVTFVLRNRGRLGFIRQMGDVLVLQRLRFLSEVRSPLSLDVPDVQLADEELMVASTLINYLSRPFHLEGYRDTYTEELQRVIEEKVQGKHIASANPVHIEPTKPADMMKALRASLENGKGGRFRMPVSKRRTKQTAQGQKVG